MNIQFFCPRWGSERHNWKDFLGFAKAAGYQGVEYAISQSTPDWEMEEAFNDAAKLDLLVIAQHYDTVSADFMQHHESYHGWLERIKVYPAVKINSQTGRDLFSFQQNSKLIALGNRYGAVHETHRGKFSFSAHGTEPFLQQIPDLRLTLDASHWVCVAESYLHDQQPAMDLAISRTDHIHARVGYTQGPQVTDPFLAEWETALDVHVNWWDQVVAHKRSKKEPILTITPECGPYPYMVETPLIRKPLSSQWDINERMMNFLRTRYA